MFLAYFAMADTGNIGIYVGLSAWPNVSLLAPSNASTSDSANVTFVCTASDETRVENISLYVNNELNATQQGDNTSSLSLAKTVTLANGVYNWRCEARDNQNNLGNATNRVLTVSISAGGGSTMSVSTGSSGGGGGGGAKGGVKKTDFLIDTALLKARSTIGAAFTKSITITNPTGFALLMNVSVNVNYLLISEKEFLLKPNETKTVYVTFVASENIKEDVYTGNIAVQSQFEKKDIPFIFEVRSKQILFDVSLNIPSKYKTLKAGEELFFQITLFNLGETGKVDVTLEYGVKDFNGKMILEEKGVVAVETQASFSRSIELPENMASGDYTVFARAIYGDSTSTASDIFSIPIFSYFWIVIVLIGVLSIGIIGGVVFFYEKHQSVLKNLLTSQGKELSAIRQHLQSKKIKVVEAVVELKKLQAQKELLESAYEKGYVSRQAYLASKEKINSLARSAKEKHL